MTATDFMHMFDGLAGMAALFLGYQVRTAVRSINKVIHDHEDRLDRLERKVKRGAR